MKLTKIVLLFSAMLFGIFTAEAQTKKKLKAENEQLKASNTILQQRVQVLEKDKRALSLKNEAFGSNITRLRRDSAVASMDYKLMSDEFTKYRATMVENSKKVEEKTGYTLVDPNDTRPCAVKQAQLEAGYSYEYGTLKRIRTKGYGVQIYSYGSLCNALDKASEFTNYYQMYKTYIMVKIVNNKKIFSVVYGSLKDEQQARTYTDLFKQNARVKERSSAFMVQHESSL
ncbi:MAG: septal ring-binding cell division protein DamX [Bacteroidia bacterium]|jgi:septal ring-binding cell division protein DamX